MFFEQSDVILTPITALPTPAGWYDQVSDAQRHPDVYDWWEFLL